MYKPLSEEASDRQAALSMIYQSVKDRIGIKFADFEQKMADWNVIPLVEQGWIIGGVITKQNELHVGYGVKPAASIRGHIKLTIKKLIDEYGCAITSVMKENKNGLNFCKRLGFVEFEQKQDKIYLKCDRCKYV